MLRILLLCLLLSLGAVAQRLEPCAICSVTEGARPEAVSADWEYLGQTYYFCSVACQKRFQEDPAGWADRYSRASAAPETPSEVPADSPPPNTAPHQPGPPIPS